MELTRTNAALIAGAVAYFMTKDKKKTAIAAAAGYFLQPYLVGAGAAGTGTGSRVLPSLPTGGSVSPGQTPTDFGRLVQRTGEALETLFKRDVRNAENDFSVTDPTYIPADTDMTGRGPGDYGIV